MHLVFQFTGTRRIAMAPSSNSFVKEIQPFQPRSKSPFRIQTYFLITSNCTITQYKNPAFLPRHIAMHSALIVCQKVTLKLQDHLKLLVEVGGELVLIVKGC